MKVLASIRGRRAEREPNSSDVRKDIATRFLAGSGVEIGALHNPLPVPSNVRVRYVDRMPVDGLRQQYPELAETNLVKVDLIMNGETLCDLANGSQDFVIANHFIEHCQNPIRTIQNFMRVLRTGGVLYMAVPHKLYTFDRDRPVTSLEHVIRDDEEGPEGSHLAHVEEWSRLVNKTPEANVADEVQRLLKTDYSIHYHVWTEIGFLELLVYCHQVRNMPFSIELYQHHGHEIILILMKQ